MEHNIQFYRHIGVYGICVKDNNILVIQKILGPYTGKYDLPGGRLERYESIEQGVVREFKEETGYSAQALHHIGACDFSVIWTLGDHREENLHHIAIFYEIGIDADHAIDVIDAFDDQDSSGAVWLPFEEVNANNSSPLVLQAREYMSTHTLPLSIVTYDYRK